MICMQSFTKVLSCLVLSFLFLSLLMYFFSIAIDIVILIVITIFFLVCEVNTIVGRRMGGVYHLYSHCCQCFFL